MIGLIIDKTNIPLNINQIHLVFLVIYAKLGPIYLILYFIALSCQLTFDDFFLQPFLHN